MRAVLLGCGEVGQHLARVLLAREVEVVLVDRDAGALSLAEENLDVLTLAGDITHWATLEKAGAANAGLVVAVTDSDETNIVAAAMATKLGAARSIARVDAAGFYRSPMPSEPGPFGFTWSLCASRLVAQDLLRLIRQRSADRVLDFVAHAIRIAVLRLGHDSPLLGTSAGDLDTSNTVRAYGVIREGVLRPGAEINRLEEGDRLVLAGSSGEVAVAQHHLLGTLRQHRIVLIGGGDVGQQLARPLVKTERSVRIIEQNRRACAQLAERIPEATIIAGDGTSIALLKDQEIHAADAVVAVTPSDDTNLMASLLARDLGAPAAFALVRRHGYADVYRHLGLAGTVGPHDVIGRMVLALLPEHGVMRREELADCSHDLVEYMLPGTTTPLSLADLALAPGCVPLAVAREQRWMAPDPGMRLQERDHLLLAEPHHARKEVAARIAELARRSR